MLHPKIREYVSRLGDAELVEYALTGQRMYEAEAVAFAREELKRRNMPAEKLAAIREPIDTRLAVQDLNREPADFSRRSEAAGVVCDCCGLEAPTQFVQYSQNIGLLFARQSSNYAGSYCKRCTTSIFWRTTLITLLLGWWGIVSMLVAPAYLIANLLSFMRTFSLAPVPEGAKPPEIDMVGVAKVNACMELIDTRLADGVSVSDIAREIAPRVKLTPAQTWCGIMKILQSRTESLPVANERTGGFPVVMDDQNQPSSD